MSKKAQEVSVGKTYRPELNGRQVVLVDMNPEMPRGMRSMITIHIPAPKKKTGVFILVDGEKITVQYHHSPSATPHNERIFPVTENKGGKFSRPEIVLKVAGKKVPIVVPVKVVPKREPTALEEMLDEPTLILPEGKTRGTRRMERKMVGVRYTHGGASR